VIVRQNDMDITTAKIRREQVLADIARINTVLSRVHDPFNRITLESALNTDKLELDELNRFIANEQRR